MFTGLIEDLGRVRFFKQAKQGHQINISTELAPLQTGESIAVNGVCLTVVESTKREFTAEVMPETFSRTNLQKLRPNDSVNLERALRVGDRLGGHFVTGHVDGVGSIVGLQGEENSVLMKVQCPRTILNQSVVKGSIAIDGVSLTIADLTDEALVVSLVTHTLEVTNLGDKGRGETVNLESDLIGKYLYKYLSSPKGGSATREEEAGSRSSSGLDAEFLREHGFGNINRRR